MPKRLKALIFLMVLSAALPGLTRGADVSTHALRAKPQALSAADDTVLAGYHTATTLHAVNTNLAVGNIAVGKTIFGFAGTYTSDANATAAQILASQTAYVNGVKLTGTLVPRALPDTGQSASYTATVGEDHDYAPAATQPSFTDNGNFTITDNRTGLMWKKCSEGQNNDATCSGTAGTYTWEGAITRCEGLTTPVYTDWRLPNVRELMSIVNYQNSSPAINTTYFPATASAYYWGGTTLAPSSANALYVYFGYGKAAFGPKTTTVSVRCVRAGP